MNTHFSYGTAVVGLVFIAFGVLFLLDDQDIVRVRPMLVIPLLLIGLGVGLIARIVQPSRRA
jgi:hypothetical protein